MVVIGAGGLAIEILEILSESYLDSEIYFFDNVNDLPSKYLFDKYKILSSLEEVINIFTSLDNNYCIGVGGIDNKIKLIKLFNSLGGELCSVISKECIIGKHNVSIGKGSVIMPGVKISNNVSLGVANLVYYNSVITHDCSIGDYCEIAPSVNILGRVSVGQRVWCGANCTILPKITISNDVVIGAGAVVTKNIENKCTVVGIPARKVN